jgi:hypothetical protein
MRETINEEDTHPIKPTSIITNIKPNPGMVRIVPFGSDISFGKKSYSRFGRILSIKLKTQMTTYNVIPMGAIITTP